MIFEKMTAMRKIAAGLIMLYSLCFAKLALHAECPPYEPSGYCCLESKITVNAAGQYPKYIQKSPGNVGGHTEGCGFGCVTGGVGECGWSGHDWACNVTAGGMASGAVTYTANLQMTQESGCTLSRVSAPTSFQILVDAGKPQTVISYPEENGIIKAEDNITGTATDDYQLGQIGTGGFPGYTYSFLGTRQTYDDGGTLYYNTPELRTAFWSVPVYAVVPVSTDTLQEITLNLSDAVGNYAEVKRFMYVDFLAPQISIVAPSVGGWSVPSMPIIRGHVSDDIGIEKVWVTVRDEIADRYWDGAQWVGGVALIDIQEVASKKSIDWEYTGLSQDKLKSGNFTIRAYAKDKVGRISIAEVPSIFKKRIDLGIQKFTAYTLNVKTVENRSYNAQNPNSFTSLTGEQSIYLEGEILPNIVAPFLEHKIEWQIDGLNQYSGTPATPTPGKQSHFYVTVPPVPPYPDGRLSPMGYAAYAYIADKEGTVQSWGKAINQDTIDKCRQEYADMRKSQKPSRDLFSAGASQFNTGTCGAYIMLQSTIEQYNAARNGVFFSVLLGSAYRNPIYNARIGGAMESPHIYGKGLDLNPSGRADCNSSSAETRAEYAERMRSLFVAAPGPKLLERGATVLDPSNLYNGNPSEDTVPDVFDICRGGADHVHIGSGN